MARGESSASILAASGDSEPPVFSVDVRGRIRGSDGIDVSGSGAVRLSIIGSLSSLYVVSIVVVAHSCLCVRGLGRVRLFPARFVHLRCINNPLQLASLALCLSGIARR